VEGVLNVSSYVRKCNCFSTLENGVDNVHVAFAHAKSNFTKHGLNWDIPKITAEETGYGVAMYATRGDGKSRINHYIMPNLLYIKGSPSHEGGWRDSFGWRVPIDDCSHASFNLSLVHITGEAAEREREMRKQRRATLAGLPSAREVAEAVLAGKLNLQDIEDRPDIVNIQDHVAQEGQGAIPDRDAERLGRSDAAIILMRKIWLRELRALAEGRPLKEWRLPGEVQAKSGV
jgi:5,5'-dehydrodivanillate O-demethylase